MPIHVETAIVKLLDERGIRHSDIEMVIAYVKETGNFFNNPLNGRRLAYHRPSTTTFWVECEEQGGVCTILSAYSHRMRILEGLNTPANGKGEALDWVCAKCNIRLEQATVKLSYLDETFTANIPACPSCQRVFVSEKDALEKMALAEKMLEDK